MQRSQNFCARNAAVTSLNVTILGQQTRRMMDSLKSKEPVFLFLPVHHFYMHASVLVKQWKSGAAPSWTRD